MRNVTGRETWKRGACWKCPANALSWSLTPSSHTYSCHTSATPKPVAISEMHTDCEILFPKRTWRQLQTLKKPLNKKKSRKLFSVTKQCLPSCQSALQDGIHSTCQIANAGAYGPQSRNTLSHSTQLLGYFKVLLHNEEKKQMPRN